MSTAAIPNATGINHHRLTRLSVRPRTLLAAGANAVLIAAVIAAFSDGWGRLAHAYLLAITFCLSISLGALFFVNLQHLVGAKWSVAVRRVAELLTSALPILGLLFTPVLASMFFGSSDLYHWNDSHLAETDELIRHKAVYLNAPFFAARFLVYMSSWILLSRFFLRHSVALDRGDSSAAARMRRWSGPAMMLFAVTVNFAAFDLLMSLDPHWFSAIYGVYFFGGCVVAFFASIPLFLLFVQSQGVLREEVTIEHFHDLAKLLFGFVFFWGYIAFSQYLLIWYANIPEETGWFAVRQNNGWQAVSLLLIVGHFVLPFIGLMSRAARRSRKKLLFWCVFLLAMHLVDLYWLVMPSIAPEMALPSIVDVLCVGGVGFIWLGVTLRAMLRFRLLPEGDPHLQESLAFHNV